MERTILVFFVIISLVLVIVMTCYFVTFGGSLSKDRNDWGSFGALIGGLSMPLFSLANIKIWLYQSRRNIEAMKDQVILQERLTLLTGLQSKLLFVAKVHTSYIQFEQEYWESYRELKRWQFGIYAHIFDNNTTLLNNAFNTLEALDQTWKKYNLTNDRKSEEILTDISNPEFQKELSQHEQPLLDLIKFYREQVK